MENQIEHFLPKGQTEIKDSIFICEDTHKCETCSSFLYSLSEIQIKTFLQADDFTYECSSLSITVPAKKANKKFFTVEGIQQLFKEISMSKNEEEEEHVEWDKTISIVSVTPFFVDSESGEVGIHLDILLKPYLDIYQIYFLEVRLKELQYPSLLFEFNESLSDQILKDKFLDKQVVYSEMPAFLNYMGTILSDTELEDLKFILCWGVFDVERKDNGDWFVQMLDLNQKSKQVKNVPF
jgi:hypothetical protein